MRAKNIWVVGGDRRQRALAALLRSEGHTVHTFALEGDVDEKNLDGLGLADCVVLPLPAGAEGALNAPLSGQRHELAGILAAMERGQLLCAGMADGTLCAMAAERGIILRDYFAREELALRNAVPTAEGAIQLALEKLPITLHGARVLVVGFGRIGQALALRLRGLGARTTVCARRAESRALASSMGFSAQRLEGMAERMCGYDLVVNTVPAPVLGAEELSALKKGALVIDLASEPGGVSRESAEALGVNWVWARGLPGKTAPVTAGRYIMDTVEHIMEEEGV